MGSIFGIFFPILKDYLFLGTTVRDFTQMNELCEKYGDKLVILAFPTNQFGHQENSSGQEIINALKYVRPGNGFQPKCIMFDKVSITYSMYNVHCTYSLDLKMIRQDHVVNRHTHGSLMTTVILKKSSGEKFFRNMI